MWNTGISLTQYFFYSDFFYSDHPKFTLSVLALVVCTILCPESELFIFQDAELIVCCSNLASIIFSADWTEVMEEHLVHCFGEYLILNMALTLYVIASIAYLVRHFRTGFEIWLYPEAYLGFFLWVSYLTSSGIVYQIVGRLYSTGCWLSLHCFFKCSTNGWGCDALAGRPTSS